MTKPRTYLVTINGLGTTQAVYLHSRAIEFSLGDRFSVGASSLEPGKPLVLEVDDLTPDQGNAVTELTGAVQARLARETTDLSKVTLSVTAPAYLGGDAPAYLARLAQSRAEVARSARTTR